MFISREIYQMIDPNNAEDRVKYQNAVIDEIQGSKREFVSDPDWGGWHDLNLRPVIYFGYGLNGWVKRLRMEPFGD